MIADDTSTVAPPISHDARGTPAPPAVALLLTLFLLGAGSVLLLGNLGHYDLWCDEADTALFAQGIVQTGDLSAVSGHNVYAYRNGSLLRGLVNRYTPPLSYYLAAGFVATLDDVRWAVRLPFALSALACLALVAWWLWRDRASTDIWVAVTLGFVGNVSFFLYGRQGRYYALAMLASLVAVYAYVHGLNTVRRIALFSLAMLVLLATQYLNYAGLVAALAVDFLAFGRRHAPLKWRTWVAIVLPQLLAGIVLVSTWNPVGRGVTVESVPWWYERRVLLWWNLRDLAACQYGVGWLILLAPAAAWVGGQPWLLRGFVGGLAYVAAVVLVSPQPIALTEVADVRYLTPLIPLTIALTVLTPVVLAGGRRIVWVPLVVVASLTTVLHQPWPPSSWRSPVMLLGSELARGRETSMMAAGAWIRAHVAPGESVAVYPPEQMYPLMVHAPQAVYAWQLSHQPDRPLPSELAQLPDVHHFGREPVDWLVVFGSVPETDPLWSALARFHAAGTDYQRSAQLDVYWQELTRPELFWHSFRPIRGFDPETEAVYIYRRVAVR